MMRNENKISDRNFIPELEFKMSRSSGPGGQNVNKVNTKVELRFDINKSLLLSEEEKEKIFLSLKNKINNDGILIIVTQETRSMFKNKEICLKKFYEQLENVLKVEKERKKTNIPLKYIERRLKSKKQNSEKKDRRRFFE
jgi:ribosome-associated protein